MVFFGEFRFFPNPDLLPSRLTVRPMNAKPPRFNSQNSMSSGQRLERQFEDAQGELLGTLYYVVGNMEDARDALQESFLKCWRCRDQIEHVANLRAWVFRITLNTGRDCRKAAWNRRRQPILEDMSMVSVVDPPDVGLLQSEQQSQLRQAVMSLRTEEQDVFLLRQNGELTYEQIAEATALPLGTVKTRMRAAIRHLREFVGDQS